MKLFSASIFVGLLASLAPVFLFGDDLPKTVSIQLQPAEPLPRQLFTFNTDMATAIMFRGVGYDSPQFEDAVRQLRPQGLRFPGGTLANNYVWSQDSFSEPTNDKTGWAAEHLKLFRRIGRPYDLPGFARVARRNQLSPIWVLNVYEETPTSVLALFERLDSLGLNVTFVEMANEPYWDGRSMADVKSYIQASRPLAEVLKKHRPNVRIGACFAPFDNSANYEVIWNAPLAKENWFDAVVFHEYYGGQGFALEKGQQVSAEALQHPEAMIDEPVEKLRKLMPDKPIWFTEWNIGMEGLNQWKNTGAELQYVAAMFASLIDHRDAIELACFHAFYDSRFGAFYINDKTGQVETNASYELLRMVGTAFSGANELRPITFSGDELRGFATQRSDDIRLFVLNRGKEASTVRLPESLTGEIVRLTIDCTSARKLTLSTALAESVAIAELETTLPANSISLIGRRSTLEFKAQAVANENLFPRRPDLMLWYEPFAAEQPRFDADGVYVVDLGKFKDKKLAVLKMNLASSRLEAGREYSLDLEAKASVEGGLIVKLPQSDHDDGLFSPTGGDFTRLRYTFKFDPKTNEGSVTIVFAEEMISEGATVALRNFHIFVSN